MLEGQRGTWQTYLSSGGDNWGATRPEGAAPVGEVGKRGVGALVDLAVPNHPASSMEVGIVRQALQTTCGSCIMMSIHNGASHTWYEVRVSETTAENFQKPLLATWGSHVSFIMRLTVGTKSDSHCCKQCHVQTACHRVELPPTIWTLPE